MKGTLQGDFEELCAAFEVVHRAFQRASGIQRLLDRMKKRESVKRLAIGYGSTIEPVSDLYDEMGGEFGAELVLWTSVSLGLDPVEAKKIVVGGMERLGDAARKSGMIASEAAESLGLVIRSNEDAT